MRTAKELSDWQGYLTHKEIDEIKRVLEIARNKRATTCAVNIGAGSGTSTISMLEQVNDIVVFSIDILTNEKEVTTNEHLRLQECGEDYYTKVIKIWGDSKVVGINWPLKVDFVFVDGDHSFEGCAGDIKAWLKHVKKGGVIAFHDYESPNWPDVKNACDLYMKNFEFLGKADTVVSYRVK